MTATNQHIIWHIAAWWPTAEKPGNGLFIGAHIRSILSIGSHKVVYLKIEKATVLFPSISIEEISGDIDEFIVRIKTPIRRFGVANWLINRGYSKVFNLLEKRFGVPSLIHVHVRSHLTKHAIALLKPRMFDMVLSEHFSFYHRGIKTLPEEQQLHQKNEISAFFQSENLKAIMPVSQELAYVLVNEFSAPKDRLIVIPNIADECFGFLDKEDRTEIRIALVAAWHFPKNPFVFFKAVHMLPGPLKKNIQIDIVGHGRQLEEMKSKAQQDLMDVKVNFHGYKAKLQIAPILQQADFFIHPTDQENLPTVIAESLSCGTPVLSMNVNGIPEMVDSSNGLLVPPKNAAALREGIETMIAERNSFDRKSIAEAAQKRYSKEVIGVSLERIYHRVLN